MVFQRVVYLKIEWILIKVGKKLQRIKKQSGGGYMWGNGWREDMLVPSLPCGLWADT